MMVQLLYTLGVYSIEFYSCPVHPDTMVCFPFRRVWLYRIRLRAGIICNLALSQGTQRRAGREGRHERASQPSFRAPSF